MWVGIWDCECVRESSWAYSVRKKINTWAHERKIVEGKSWNWKIKIEGKFIFLKIFLKMKKNWKKLKIENWNCLQNPALKFFLMKNQCCQRFSDNFDKILMLKKQWKRKFVLCMTMIVSIFWNFREFKIHTWTLFLINITDRNLYLNG